MENPAVPDYRPQIHYSPQTGFMNDPNGLVFHDGEYHLFYQYNPFGSRHGRMHWGHAVSRDLLRWTTLPIALKESASGQVFSGSAVWDAQNTSGLFANGSGGLVAIYTRAAPSKQAQEIAFSADQGRSFNEYSGNPVLDIGSSSFRDPQVTFHGPSNRWIMAAVRAREHRVVFYGSQDLKRWTELSSFGMAGVLGRDDECPNLVEVPTENGFKWVLFVSINPGAPQGGSAVQYFVGEFDGTRFTPDDSVTRFADFGKDFYALQTFNGLPKNAPIAIGWMSNWQYANETPTGDWRGLMSLPRHLRLRRKNDDWRLLQEPPNLDSLQDTSLAAGPFAMNNGKGADIRLTPGAAVEIRLNGDVAKGAITTIRFANAKDEHLDVGFDAGVMQLFADRGTARGFAHRFFTDKFSAALDPETQRLDLHIIFDRCTLEVFAQNGEACGSLLHFFRVLPNRLTVSSTAPTAGMNLNVRTLRSAR